MKNDLLLDLLPKSLLDALHGLPKRLEFLNNRRHVMLAELRRGQELSNFTPPFPLTMLVERGRICIKDDRGLHKLEAGRKYRLNSSCEIRVLRGCQLCFAAASRARTAKCAIASLMDQVIEGEGKLSRGIAA